MKLVGTARRAPLPTLAFADDDVSDDVRAKSAPLRSPHAYLPWQCLYFLPEPQGQSSLRPTLPQLAGFFGSRLAVAAGTSEAPANANASSPVFGSNLCASMCGSTGCWSSGGTISTRISCAVTASRKCAIIASNRLNASDLYSCSGSRWP